MVIVSAMSWHIKISVESVQSVFRPRKPRCNYTLGFVVQREMCIIPCTQRWFTLTISVFPGDWKTACLQAKFDGNVMLMDHKFYPILEFCHIFNLKCLKVKIVVFDFFLPKSEEGYLDLVIDVKCSMFSSSVFDQHLMSWISLLLGVLCVIFLFCVFYFVI